MELGAVAICDERFAGDEDNWQGEERDCEDDVEER